MEGKKVYFISDLHLGAAYIADEHEAERRAVRFIEHIRPTAEALYLMGDVLDYWYEYRTVVPRGYVRFFGALASLADAGVRVYWFIGNHDIWLFDYLRHELGITVIDGSQVVDIKGSRFFLAHGDGLGKVGPGFRMIRWLFRSRLCQLMYAAVHPRWTVPLAHLWSSKNRDIAHYSPEFTGMDSDPLALYAREYLRQVDPTVNYFVFGHEHVLVDEALTPSCRLVILGEWIKLYSYAEFDGKTLELHKFIDQNH